MEQGQYVPEKSFPALPSRCRFSLVLLHRHGLPGVIELITTQAASRLYSASVAAYNAFRSQCFHFTVYLNAPVPGMRSLPVLSPRSNGRKSGLTISKDSPSRWQFSLDSRLRRFDDRCQISGCSSASPIADKNISMAFSSSWIFIRCP